MVIGVQDLFSISFHWIYTENELKESETDHPKTTRGTVLSWGFLQTDGRKKR